ncbi:hypothetical protein ACFHWD_03940 [Clostridium sp. MT-14]|jgi:lipoate-protein ligase B|uniref:hypothetical protein n=1 Tax=Clostridium sp. MT-14 TaxID=3348360 RepID=UPI0035F228F4
MAKSTNKISFSKATLSKNDKGEYIVEEINKDDSKIYNLSKELDKFISYEGLSINVSQDCVIPPEE